MKTTPPALLLDRGTIAQLLPLDDCIGAVEHAFAAHARGESLASGLLHGDGIGGEFHLKAGGLRTPRAYYACKVNGGFFHNRATNGLPNIQGLVLLYDASNGQPLAVMESAEITIKRTAAATAVAARYLSRQGASVATIAGAGTQAAAQLEALTRVRPIERAYVWSRDPARAAMFATGMSGKLQRSIEARANFTMAARASDIIVTCTPAKRWFLGNDMVSPGTFVAAVGADSPDKQELEPALLAESAVVTDLTAQCAHVGELHHAIAAGVMTAADVRGEIGEVIVGAAPGRQNDHEIIVFDSTGTALQDAAAAAFVFEKATAAGRGSQFAFWGT